MKKPIILLTFLILLIVFSLSQAQWAFKNIVNGWDKEDLSGAEDSADMLHSLTAQNKPREAVLQLAEKITVGKQSEEEKMEAIYDWVTANIAYNLNKAENPSAYDSGALFALESGTAVCHDYAELTRDLLKAVKIEASYVSGEVTIEENNTELHAWNEALVAGKKYALDPTWGAGFITDDHSGFIQRPRRIYLTSPEELQRLHSDPCYKQSREEEYFKNIAISMSPLIESQLEWQIYCIYEDIREENGLSLLAEDQKLKEIARNYAFEYAERICFSEEPDLTPLIEELKVKSEELQLRAAAVNVMAKWLLEIDNVEQIKQQIAADLESSLAEPRWRSLSIAAVSRGDLFLVVTIFLE